jgi:multicomponent Na+:H+ antiporter subunit D
MALPSLAVIVPLLAAAALVGTTWLGRRRAADAVALAAAAAVAAICIALLLHARDGTVVSWLGGWRPRRGIALGIALVGDPLGAALAAFTALLAIVALVVALRMEDTAGHLFHALVLGFLAAAAGFCLAGDLFTAFVFFELLGVTGYALTGHLVDHRSPVEGALNFAVTNTVGSVLLLTGVALLYGRTGALNLAQMGTALGRADADALVAVAFALVCSGFFVKAAIVPFHFWLADAYAAAPAAVCVLFAGVMSELGLYGAARAYWTVFEPVLHPHAGALRGVLLAVGALTALTGAGMGVAQRHLKRLLAFATISRMGVLLLALALLTPEGIAGAAVYVVGDGLVKAGLFVAVASLQERTGHVDDVSLYGRGRDMPGLGVVVAAGGLAIAGLPLFGPWLGRALVDHSAERLHVWWLPALLALAAALSGGAVLRMVRTVFLGRGPVGTRDPASGGGEEDEDAESAGGPSRLLLLIAAGLVVAGMAWGLIPGLADAAARAAARFADTGGYARAVLGGAAVASPPASAPAPSASAFVYGLLGAAGALAVGAGGLLARRERGTPRVLHALRDVHSGRAGDYLAWLAAGSAALAAAFLAALT